MTQSVLTQKRSLLAVAASAAGLATAALLATQPVLAENHDEAETLTKGEQRLAEMLEGRVAGEPQSCIRTQPNYRLTVIDDTAYVYGRGKTIYVQRTRNPQHIDSDDTIVSRRFSSSELCKLDTVTTIDRFGGFFTGVVFFDDFIPYTRVEANEG